MVAAQHDAASLYRRSGHWLGAWAVRRSVSPNSLAGISLLLAVCAGAWFSGGTVGDAARGLIGVAAWLLALGAARSLAALTAPQEATARTRTARVAGEAIGQANLTVGGPLGSRFGWVYGVCSAAAECAVYGGIAAGGTAGAWIGMWPLAVVTIASVAVAEMLEACRTAATAGRACEAAEEQVKRQATRWAGSLRSPPVGVRALIAVAGLVIAGPQAALFAVLAAEVISIAAVIATLARVVPPASTTRTARTQTVRKRTVWTLTAPTASSLAAAAPARGGMADDASAGVSGAVLLTLRDDGAAARWAGRLVKGMLIPLPPAFAGLIATALLAALGLHNLPGFIAMTSPVVMMLAAPGSSHPHDGRFDWLVPALLVAVQLVYFGSLGFALAVPGPVIFSACAMTYVWYAGVIRSAAQVEAGAAPSDAPGRAVGWESRMLTVGLAATLGLATVGYVVLAAYLGAFICRAATIGYLVTTEDDRR